MSGLNRDRKLFDLVGVALLGCRVVIRGNFSHEGVALQLEVILVTQKSYLPY